jgi:hypothetical protein
MILPDDIDQMMQLKSILTIFNASIGLKINFHKTTLVRINIDIEQVSSVPEAFGCKVESMPVTTLVCHWVLQDLLSLILGKRLGKRLSRTLSLMSYTGRLILLNSLFNSMSMYAMCSFRVPITIFLHFEKVEGNSYGLIKMTRSK